MMSWIVELDYYLKALRDLFFPRKCIVCKESLSVYEHNICLKCYADVPLTYFWRWSGNPAEERMWKRVPIEKGASMFYYRNTDGYSHIVHKIKYEGRRRFGKEVGKIFGEYLGGSGRFADIDAIIPVPLHLIREWKRGYNQAEIISEGIREGISVYSENRLIVVPNLLKRTRYTKTQTRLSGEAKDKNVKNAFSINHAVAARLKAEGIDHILVVDDVLTSGSTLEECVTPLLPYFKVSIATLGFVE